MPAATINPSETLLKARRRDRTYAAELHLLPTLWFRNDWSSWIAESNRSPKKPNLKQIKATAGASAVAAHYQVKIGAGHTTVIRLRLSSGAAAQQGQPFGRQFDEVFAGRLRKADEFYQSVTPPSVSADAANVYTAASVPVDPEAYKKIDPKKLAVELAVDMCAVNSGG